MIMQFSKFHGNGNDFVAINNMTGELSLKPADIKLLCDRRFGVGADGVIELRSDKEKDFELIYYNSDGCKGSMCGNGGRCAVAFAQMFGIIDGQETSFRAFDGIHKGIVNKKVNSKTLDISLQMSDVLEITKNMDSFFLDTGSPHHIEFVDNAYAVDVFQRGMEIRNSDKYKPGGTNVDFVELKNDSIYVRTYERGVEDETLSCGTGVTASAIATGIVLGINKVNINTKGGEFVVTFKLDSNEMKARNIWLVGPAELVFNGEYKINIDE